MARAGGKDRGALRAATRIGALVDPVQRRRRAEASGEGWRQAPTLREAWEDYREERDASLHRPDHDGLYQRYWCDLYGHLRLDVFKVDELHRWRSRRLKQVKASTVNRALTDLQAICSLAARDALLAANTGLRRGEQFGGRRKEIDHQTPGLTSRRSAVRARPRPPQARGNAGFLLPGPPDPQPRPR